MKHWSRNRGWWWGVLAGVVLAAVGAAQVDGGPVRRAAGSPSQVVSVPR